MLVSSVCDVLRGGTRMMTLPMGRRRRPRRRASMATLWPILAVSGNGAFVARSCTNSIPAMVGDKGVGSLLMESSTAGRLL